MKKVTIAVVLIFTMGIFFASCCNDTKKETKEKVEEVKTEVKKEAPKVVAMATYQCPMKCEGDKTYTEAGSCSVCKMDLKKVEGAK